MASIGSVGSAIVQGRRSSLEEYGDQLLFYVKALAWAPRAIRRYPREIVNTLAEVTFGAGGLTLIAGTVGVIAFLAFFAGHRGRHPGLRLAEPDRRREVQRLHLGLLQHPRGGSAGLLDRARRHRRLRLHRPPGGDADLGGDRRARGDGGAVAAVPGDHPDDRGLRRRHPALRRGAVRVVPLAAADRHPALRPVTGHLRPLLPPVPAPGRHAVVVRQAARSWPSRSS